MMLHEAFATIRSFAERAYIQAMPEVRLVFKDQADMSRFRVRAITDLKPSDVAADPRMIEDHFEFAGIQVNLQARDRGPRAASERTIANARSIYRFADTSSKLEPEDIARLKDSLGQLLALIGE
jgi:hypothetical protein